MVADHWFMQIEKVLEAMDIVTPRPDEVHGTYNCKGAYMHQVSL